MINLCRDEMLETLCKELIDKNTFLIHFIDKDSDSISADKSEELKLYETDDDSEIKMAIRVNAIPPSVLIDIKLKYPPNFYNPNYHELLDNNEKRFQEFYNEIMYSNQIDCNETCESYTKESIGK